MFRMVKLFYGSKRGDCLNQFPLLRALIFYPMAKDPAVLLYTSDFLSGTFTMSNEQVGMYIRLLCYQHQKGKLSEKDMLAICPGRDQEIFSKFDFIDGFYINKRMYAEAEKRKNFIEKQKDRSNKRWKKDDATDMPRDIPRDMPRESLLENENENENRNENKEGGMGGDLWTDHKRMFLEDGGWKFKFCTAKALSKYELDEYMRIFIEDIELKSDYKEKKELQRHFTNWFNLQKKKNGKRTPKNGTYQLLEELRQEHQASLRGQNGAGY